MPDVKLKGWSGSDFEYNTVPKVWLEASESTEEVPVLVPFTYGEAVAKTVEPDFSGGDMSVPIPEGELVTQLTIAKPENLVPENISMGEYIAGVGPGTFEGAKLDFDFTDPVLRYLAYQIDFEAKTVNVYYVLFSSLYELTGSYSLSIPSKLGNYDVVLACT